MNYYRKNNVPVVKEWESRSDLQLSTQFSSEAAHNRTRVLGTEFLGRINAYTTEAGFASTDLGEVLYRQPLAPLMLNGTRLKKFAEMFQTYDANHLSMHFVPLVPATQNGGTVFTPIYDPDMSLTHISNGDEFNRIVLSMEESVYAGVFSPVSVIWHKNIMKGLFTRIEDSDARLEIPGDILVTSGSTYSPFDGSATKIPLYGIWLSYDITFHNRGLVETDQDLGVGTVTTGALPVTASGIFYGFGSQFNANEPVCLLTTIPALSAYANPSYILMCYVEGNDPGGHPNWNLATFGDMAFVRDEDSGEFLFTKGTQFYMFYVRSTTGDQCFYMSTNLTSALEGRPDIYYAPAMDGQTLSQDLVLQFRFQALPR